MGRSVHAPLDVLQPHQWSYTDFHRAVGQMRLNKSSLRHKVKPIELIFCPPKNNITFWFAERDFQQPGHKTLVCIGRK